MKIVSNFDSGSIEVINATDINNIQLALVSDNKHQTRQWFHFRSEVQIGKQHIFRIINASESSFANAWRGYQAMASYDQKSWFRVDTQYIDGELLITHTPNSDQLFIAYFTPYSYQQHQALMQTVSAHPDVTIDSLLTTELANSVDLLTIGTPSEDKLAIWVIARQHPGETMAQWFSEGLINRLLTDNTMRETLLDKSVFYIVPNMNPDGSILGNHRTNAYGQNLNRCWGNPSQNECPEVHAVQQKMANTGVDLLLDIHGEEQIPYSFIMPAKAGCRNARLAKAFKDQLAQTTQDFQTKIDYGNYQAGERCCQSSCGSSQISQPCPCGVTNEATSCCEKNEKPAKESTCSTSSCCENTKELRKTSTCATNSCCEQTSQTNSCGKAQSGLMATEYVANTFNCLAMVLEMPFIDHLDNANAHSGWTAERSAQLGRDVLTPLLNFVTQEIS